MSYFMDTTAHIESNSKLRKPQIEAYIKIQEYFRSNPHGEALVVLPTGTGKTGLVSIAPYGVAQGRVLIVTPGLVTKQSIKKTQEPLEGNFWVNYDVIFDPERLPIVSEYHPGISDEHLAASHIVYSNIHRLRSANSGRGLIDRVPSDFFDMIIVDEAHHAPAQSWREVLAYFASAKKLHLTGTPYRGDQQEIPGEEIHQTALSEAMRERYVKFLRKETVNAHELYFTVPDQPGKKFSKDEILEIKEAEWIERNVALAESCSRDVIAHSVRKLNEFKSDPRSVPHKILAVGCSIAHAERLCAWYKDAGLESVIVHSKMAADSLDAAFRSIDNNDCQVVISVNMLMEGYDHHYLSVLAIFRPFRSLNAFAQVVGRILRAIPADMINAFEIDNNAMVVYHEEIGLDAMWHSFQTEVDRAKHQRVREYTGAELDRAQRDSTAIGVDSSSAFVSNTESYLRDIDFNEMFASKRAEVLVNAEAKLSILRGSDLGLTAESLEAVRELLIKQETKKAAQEIDQRLIEKRPDLARKKIRETITVKIRDEATNILSDKGLDEKGTELAPRFRFLKLPPGMPNDGTLVRFMNAKLLLQFGPVDKRDNNSLLRSLEAVPGIAAELRRML